MKHFFLLSALITTILTLNQCARNPVTGKRQVVLMSEAQEIAMGKEADPQIIQQFGLYEDKALQSFITEKGKAMAAISHRPNLNYEFRIVDSDVINAFAVPGGYVYFTRGIMAHFNNEAEFAGVLGHEIGHITARHSVAQQRNAILGQIGLIGGIIVAPELAQYAETASQGLGLLLLKFGRDAEREADKLGVEYSSKIQYDAQQMANFFKTLERKSQESGSEELPGFLSTHPNPGDRNRAVSELATQWKQKLNLTDAQVNRNSYLKKIEGLIYGEDPKQGFVENDVFYHPLLKIQFPLPRNWAYQNSPQAVQLGSKDGKAMMMLTMAQGQTLQEASNAILQRYSLRLLDSKEVSVNGLNAIAFLADQQPQQTSQQQQQEVMRTMSYVIQYGNNLFHLIGVAGSRSFNNYTDEFDNTMRNFRELRDASKLNRKPDRISIKTVTQDGTLQQALRTLNMQEKRFQELALLNGMKLNETVKKGTLIKVLIQQ